MLFREKKISIGLGENILSRLSLGKNFKGIASSRSCNTGSISGPPQLVSIKHGTRSFILINQLKAWILIENATKYEHFYHSHLQNISEQSDQIFRPHCQSKALYHWLGTRDWWISQTLLELFSIYGYKVSANERCYISLIGWNLA